VRKGTGQEDSFEVSVTCVRRAIVHSYRQGVYDSRAIASRLSAELAQPGDSGMRVDSHLIRELRRRERSAIESDLAAGLADPCGSAETSTESKSALRFGAMYCLQAARERLRLALWVDRLAPNQP